MSLGNEEATVSVHFGDLVLRREMAEDPEIHEQLPEDHLRKRLAAVVRKIQWSYSIFWSISARQPG